LGVCTHEIIRPPILFRKSSYDQLEYWREGRLYYLYKRYYLVYDIVDNGQDDIFNNLKIYPFEKQCVVSNWWHIDSRLNEYFRIGKDHIFLICEDLNIGIYDAYFYGKYGKIRIREDGKEQFIRTYIEPEIISVLIDFLFN
jgi:hypothetical protein